MTSQIKFLKNILKTMKNKIKNKLKLGSSMLSGDLSTSTSTNPYITSGIVSSPTLGTFSSSGSTISPGSTTTISPVSTYISTTPYSGYVSTSPMPINEANSIKEFSELTDKTKLDLLEDIFDDLNLCKNSYDITVYISKLQNKIERLKNKQKLSLKNG